MLASSIVITGEEEVYVYIRKGQRESGKNVDRHPIEQFTLYTFHSYRVSSPFLVV